MGNHLAVFFRILEVGSQPIRRVDALQGEIATALAGRLAITLDLASLALIAVSTETLATTILGIAYREQTNHAMLMYRFLFALCEGGPSGASSPLFLLSPV